jgi:hypothetical protein
MQGKKDRTVNAEMRARQTGKKLDEEECVYKQPFRQSKIAMHFLNETQEEKRDDYMFFSPLSLPDTI